MNVRLAPPALAALLLVAAPAEAATFSFTGNLSNPDQVALFNFSIAAPASVGIATFSFSGGVNNAGTMIPAGGFDPILTLADSTGAILEFDDDSGPGFDALISRMLAPGNYTVALTAFSNFAIGPNLSDGFDGGGSFNNRTSFYAFDIRNVDSAVSAAIPEPGTWALMIGGFGLVGAAMRRRVTRVTYA